MLVEDWPVLMPVSDTNAVLKRAEKVSPSLVIMDVGLMHTDAGNLLTAFVTLPKNKIYLS